ncbi:stage II sporulation protein R [Geochorda subterranea]|uniref:Stage II sporulation protein R n=1 Tax=Geochorda subterranea TaxID=3109564 RepID=A0ABZ1BTE8_9FIRM|nr:stage II sporulation protein R [Limnochorda sp. LNt]WRP15843.1 stage II sporulation protein R [Limnochorda sp. LNt]
MAVAAAVAALVGSVLAVAVPGGASASALPGVAAGATGEWGLLRLHVVAHSDRPEDQQTKRQAAQAVREALDWLTRSAPPSALVDAGQMAAYLRARAPVLEQAAARASGQHPVRVTVGPAFYPVSVDDAGRLYPAGWYLGVRVLIGAAAGRNWWCVVFPSLCPAARPDGTPAAQAAESGRSTPAPEPSATPAGDASDGAPATQGAAPTGALTASSGPAPSRPWWVRWLPWHWW